MIIKKGTPMYKLLLSLILFISLYSLEKQEAYGQIHHLSFKSEDLQHLKLYYCNKTFFVKDNDIFIILANNNIDSRLRNISEDQFNDLVKQGNLILSRNEYYEITYDAKHN